jgi:hypothetical protein
MNHKLLILFLLFTQVLSAQELSWPEISKENKPWTRWWWPGSIVTPSDITAAMEKYKTAGLGGMEIAVIYGVKGEEDKFINYLSPKWMEMLTHTLREADRLDLGIELANASGWPFGGPWVDPADACKNINYKTYHLKGGESLVEKIEFIQQALVRPVGEKPDITKLKGPVGKNDNLQLYSLDQIRFEKHLPLKELIAYSDSGQVANLTGNVNTEGKLEWIPPSGNWTLYALFEGWHGKLVERAGPGGEGDVIDHFSGKAIKNYLNHFDDIFKNYDLKSLRGYFNDSYEVDDASGQANWTNDFFYEFYLRRGYDLRNHLPALFQTDDLDKNSRVLSDYRQTMSDLILEKFTVNWTEWAHRQGKTTRDQAHGSPGNILDLYAAADIPETEGNEITRFKFATSAANVTGKVLVSCEAATWLNEHFISSLSDVKKAVDQFFLAGINHVFYHGTCFSPINEPWPGFLFYAAVEFTPSNPFWNDFKALNSYVTRVQSFMQSGRPDNDILLYFPIFDRYADYGRGMLEHFDGISPSFDGTLFKTAAEKMLEKGFSYDFISDLQIKNTVFSESLLQTEGNIYKTLIVPGCKYIPVETFSQILRLANEGAKIIFYGNLPENISGWGDKDEKTLFFEKLKASLNFSQTNNPEVVKAIYGNGMIISGNDLDQLLEFAGIKWETMKDNNFSFTRRETPGGFTYFINYHGEKAFEGWIPLQVKASSAAIFNPMAGNYGIARSRVTNIGNIEVYATLSPGESLVIITTGAKYSGQKFIYYDQVSSPVTINGNWKVDFTEGGPVLPASKEIASLASWTEFGGDDVRNFSGTAKYTVNFDKPSGKADAWFLNLGKVCESAAVTLNGRELGILLGPEFQITIDKKLLESKNTLEIKISNLMANRIAYTDRNNIHWKRFYNVNMAARLKQNSKNGIFDASAWEPRESGLLGPVTLIPLKKVKW